MPTARDLIGRTFRELGLIKSGNAMPEADYQEVLISLNALLDSLSNDKAFAAYAYEQTYTLIGTASFTVGPTGNVVSVRPAKIESAYVVLNNISYPVSIYTVQEWDSIINKTQTDTIPTAIYFEGIMPDATVKTWPISTGGVLHCRVINQVTTFATLSTALSMPIGYEEAIVKNLAVNISPQYPDGALSEITVRTARSSLQRIERNNTVIPKLSVDSRLPGLGRGTSYTDYIAG